jgi:hypothetical protein
LPGYLQQPLDIEDKYDLLQFASSLIQPYGFSAFEVFKEIAFWIILQVHGVVRVEIVFKQ